MGRKPVNKRRRAFGITISASLGDYIEAEAAKYDLPISRVIEARLKHSIGAAKALPDQLESSVPNPSELTSTEADFYSDQPGLWRLIQLCRSKGWPAPDTRPSPWIHLAAELTDDDSRPSSLSGVPDHVWAKVAASYEDDIEMPISV